MRISAKLLAAAESSSVLVLSAVRHRYQYVRPHGLTASVHDHDLGDERVPVQSKGVAHGADDDIRLTQDLFLQQNLNMSKFRLFIFVPPLHPAQELPATCGVTGRREACSIRRVNSPEC